MSGEERRPWWITCLVWGFKLAVFAAEVYGCLVLLAFAITAWELVDAGRYRDAAVFVGSIAGIALALSFIVSLALWIEDQSWENHERWLARPYDWADEDNGMAA